MGKNDDNNNNNDSKQAYKKGLRVCLVQMLVSLQRRVSLLLCLWARTNNNNVVFSDDRKWRVVVLSSSMFVLL